MCLDAPSLDWPLYPNPGPSLMPSVGPSFSNSTLHQNHLEILLEKSPGTQSPKHRVYGCVRRSPRSYILASSQVLLKLFQNLVTFFPSPGFSPDPELSKTQKPFFLDNSNGSTYPAICCKLAPIVLRLSEHQQWHPP